MQEIDVYPQGKVPRGFCRVFQADVGAWQGFVVDSMNMRGAVGGAVGRHRRWIADRFATCRVSEADYVEVSLHPFTGGYLFRPDSGRNSEAAVIKGRRGRRKKTYLIRFQAALGIASREDSDAGRSMFEPGADVLQVFALMDAGAHDRIVAARSEAIAFVDPLAIDRPEVKYRSVFDDAEVTTTLRRYVASKGLSDPDVQAVTLAATEQMAVRRYLGQWRCCGGSAGIPTATFRIGCRTLTCGGRWRASPSGCGSRRRRR